MALSNPYANYTNSRVMTASPGQLTLMLYDGAIKFCNIALVAIENHQIEKANTNIQKAQRIIEEFRATLNFHYPIAKEFDKVYEYIYRRLVEANIKKDPKILEEALAHIRTMRETWIEVMKKAKNPMGEDNGH